MRRPSSGRRSSSRTSWSRSREHLDIAARHAVVGQSWGGMLAMEYALDHPEGLRGIVVADSPASMTLWVSEANRLREDLPADVQATLTRHEQAGTTDDPEYDAAVRVFYDRHLCRVPWPDCVQRSFDQTDADPTVYHTMNGPSEFHVIGSMKDWDISDRLARDHDADPARLRPLRRGDAADRRPDPRAHPRRPVDDLREVEPHAARRGAGGVPAACGGLPADHRLIGRRLCSEACTVGHLEGEAPSERLEGGDPGSRRVSRQPRDRWRALWRQS